MVTKANINVTINTTNTDKEINTMKRNLAAETRMAILKEAGVEAKDMLQFLLKNVDTEELTKWIEEANEDPLVSKLKAEGYVPVNRLFRRWTMAQMFQMLNFYKGYNAYLDENYKWEYQIDFLIDEVNRIVHIQKDGDMETLKEYTRICTLAVIREIVQEIYYKTAEYVQRIHYLGPNLALMEAAMYGTQRISTYKGMFHHLKEFRKVMIRVPNTKKVPAFKEMYKGIGAYWTCKNLIMFHGCEAVVGKNYPLARKLNTYDSLNLLEGKARKYFARDDYFQPYRENEGGFRMFAFMKKLIEDNNFDFDKRMREVYAEKRKAM